MNRLSRTFAASLLFCSVVACQQGIDPSLERKGGANTAATAQRPGQPAKGDIPPVPPTPAKPAIEQIPAPVDAKTPPSDAVKVGSVFVKKLEAKTEGAAIKANDTVVMNYTGWKRANGETFFTTKTRGAPITTSVANTAEGFRDGLVGLRKGEKARIWVAADSASEMPEKNAVYEVEIVDIQSAPVTPADVAAPPANAKKLKSGTAYVQLVAGSGAKPREWDNVTFNYSVWDASGKLLDSSEMRKRPATAPPLRMPEGLREVLAEMSKGARFRTWLDASKMGGAGATEGSLCFEIEVSDIAKPPVEPPPVPKDVAAPPASAKKTEKGVSYIVLKPGSGAKPKVSDTVNMNYTGWTTEGRLFDSSALTGAPVRFSLGGVIVGWTDVIPLMSVGEKIRAWIPAELAYKDKPGGPQGTLVFDMELVEIVAQPSGGAPAGMDGHGPDDGHGH